MLRRNNAHRHYVIFTRNSSLHVTSKDIFVLSACHTVRTHSFRHFLHKQELWGGWLSYQHVCHIQFPEFTHCHLAAYLHLCIHKSPSTKSAWQEQNRVSWDILEMCKNRWKKKSLCGLLLYHHGFHHFIFRITTVWIKLFNKRLHTSTFVTCQLCLNCLFCLAQYLCMLT